MKSVFVKIWRLLDRRERLNAAILLSMILCMGLLEAVGVASIMPFVSVLSDRSLIHSNSYLNTAYSAFGFENTDDFLVFLGMAVFVLVVGSLGFKALTYWAMVRYTQMRNFSLSSKLLEGYLFRPYSWFLNRHSADLGKTIITEVLQVVNNALIPAVNLIANAIVGLFLLILIVLVDPLVALYASLVLGGVYLMIYALVRNRLARIGVERGRSNAERFRVAQEALGGIKDVKVHGLEASYALAFRKPALEFSRNQTKNLVIGQLPRFFLEALVFGGMLVLLLTLIFTRSGGLEAVLPLVALYVFAGARLIPAFQQVYQAFARLRYGKAALDELYEDMLETGVVSSVRTNTEAREVSAEVVRVERRLELRNVVYSYPGSATPILNGLTMSIAANTTVALVGASGAGKTTAIDLILGLLAPQEGGLFVDGSEIGSHNIRAWQRNIGYVPQNIFLTDDTVAANIAFGVRRQDIDMAAVQEAALAANLHEFIINDTHRGYDTVIGERGVRLSGGQRQRIGIARALYQNPGVLVLDEATSALDNNTERAVMEAVHSLAHSKTVIIIAHRLSTVRQCDEVHFLSDGALVASGSYSELLENPRFHDLATGHATR